MNAHKDRTTAVLSLFALTSQVDSSANADPATSATHQLFDARRKVSFLKFLD